MVSVVGFAGGAEYFEGFGAVAVHADMSGC